MLHSIKISRMTLTLSVFLISVVQADIPVVINELMASNSSVISDLQDQYDDWIEIYNYGPDAIDVGGMYLTDDLSVSAKWQIPAAEIIPAGGYLLIWADNYIADAGLHANFKLDAGGEQIALFDSDGSTLIDSIIYPDQNTDISYGRYPDASDNWQFFACPSPGVENAAAYEGFVSEVEFSHERGFYDAPFSLALATETRDAVIYYSRDGGNPYTISPSGLGVIGGTLYTGPISISGTTCLRAIAIKDGWKPTNVHTHTYIFLNDVIASSQMSKSITEAPVYEPHMRQALTDLPTISIVDPSYHLDEPVRSGPYPDWTYDEFPISFEYLTPDGSLTLQEDAGAGRYGGHFYDRSGKTYPWEKWSYRIAFRKEYGAATLKAPLFEGFDNGIPPAETFDQLEIRSGSHDMNQRGFYMSGALSTDTMLEMGNLNPHTRFVHVYINGTYWGQYNLHERWNAAMVAEYAGGEKEDYEAIKANNSGQQDFAIGEPYDGDGTAWANALAVSNSYEQVKSWVDIQSYVDFMLMFMFGESESEFRAVGSNTEGDVGFLFWLRDPDGYTGRNKNYERTGNTGPGNIFGSLVNEGHPEFMTYLADRIHKHFFNGGSLTESAMTRKLLERCNQVEVAFYAEAARWGYRTPSSWASARDACINDYLSTKPQDMIDNFIGRGLYPNVVAPVFSINDVYQHGGMINAGDAVSMSASSGTIYYTLNGDNPSLPADPPTTSDLIQRGAEWKYLDDGSDQGTAWRELSFNDASWASGPAELGYGDGDETTTVSYGPDSGNKYITTYFRHTFNLTDDPSQFTALAAWLRRDDGAVVYLNGTEIIRSGMAAGTVTYTTLATNTSGGSDESAYHMTTGIDTGLLVIGDNVIAVEVHQKSVTSSDISFDFELAATTYSGGGSGINGDEYTGPVALTKSTHVKARTLDGGTWSALNEAVYAVGDIVGSLRISELMYNPVDPNSEFIELKNIGTKALNLNLVEFTSGIDFTFPSLELAPGEFVVVVQDIDAFYARYGTEINIAGQYTGRLNNAGERIRLEDAIGTTILDFSYKDGWRSITDGDGFSLTIINPANSDANNWDEKDSWRASAYTGGSPGWDDSGIVPDPGSVVINELLANSPGGAPDWIELYNTTDAAIDIGGWYLSDSNTNLTKYRIAAGTTIAPYGYIVYYEDQHFNNPSDPGSLTGFALSGNGESLYISSAQDGDGLLTGYRQVEDFGASEAGVSFGRYFKSSTGNYNFVSMSQTTEGSANAYPKVGPVAISEIMYNPDWPMGGSYTNDQYEYIELSNISSEPVTLYSDATGLAWQFTDGIDFTFPDDVPVTIPAGGYVLVVKHPAAFSWRYPSVPAEKIFGPYDGALNNAGESVELSMPGELDGLGGGYYIRVDRVNYSDGSHPEDCPGGIDLWPSQADGDGFALTRRDLSNYGNDPANWLAANPSPNE